MTIDNDDLLNSILASLGRVEYISPEDIPNIELYGSGDDLYGQQAPFHGAVSR